MKNILLLFIVLLSCSSIVAQRPLQCGVRTNIGLYGLNPPFEWEVKDEENRRIDVGIIRPGLGFASTFLMEYRFFQKGKVSLSINAELGYQYGSMTREWQFQFGYDEGFQQHTSESRITHNLQAHYVILPIRGSLRIGRLFGTTGLIGSRVLLATVDRTYKNSTSATIYNWEEMKTKWRSNQVLDDGAESETAYIKEAFGLQALLGIGYMVSENFSISLEATTFYGRNILFVHSKGQAPIHGFNFTGSGLTLSFVLLN